MLRAHNLQLDKKCMSLVVVCFRLLFWFRWISGLFGSLNLWIFVLDFFLILFRSPILDATRLVCLYVCNTVVNLAAASYLPIWLQAYYLWRRAFNTCSQGGPWGFRLALARSGITWAAERLRGCVHKIHWGHLTKINEEMVFENCFNLVDYVRYITLLCP